MAEEMASFLLRSYLRASQLPHSEYLSLKDRKVVSVAAAVCTGQVVPMPPSPPLTSVLRTVLPSSSGFVP